MIFLVLSCVLLLIFLVVYFRNIQLKLPIILTIAFLVRLLFVFVSNGVSNYDLDSYHLVGEVTLREIDIYPTVASLHHPYLPVVLYLEALAMYMENWGMSYVHFLKTIFILFDVAVVYLIFLLSKKNIVSALLYALNPVTTLIVSFQGQLDSIPVFFLLLSMLFYKNSKYLPSMLAASFAIATKTWPVLFILPLLRRIKLIYMLFLISFPLLSIVMYSLLFGTEYRIIIETVLSYKGIVGNFGLGWIMTFVPDSVGIIIKYLSYILLFVGIYVILFKIKSNLIHQMSLLFLLFFSVTLGFGVQWLMWLVPFITLVNIKRIYIFYILSTVYICTIYYSWITQTNLNSIIISIGITVWVSILIMTFIQFKNSIIKQS